MIGNKKITDRLWDFEMESYHLPLFKEKRARGSKSWIDFGDDNLFPLYLVDLFNESAVHNAIITGKVNYIVGRGLVVKSEFKSDKVMRFVQHPNPYESLQDITRNVALDYEISNGFALKVVKKKNSTEIAEIYHQDWTTVRQHKDKKNVVLVSDEWESPYSSVGDRKPNHNPKIIEYPKFSALSKDPVSIIYYMEYRPDIKYYPYPEYVGAIPQIETTTEISKFDLNSIKNGFSGGTILNLLNGVPATDEEADEIEREATEKLTGSSNANRMMINFAEDKEHAATVESLNGNDLANRFSDLEQRVMGHVFIGHKIVSPLLFGVRTEGQLGGRREILEAYELLKETYTLRRQDTIVGVLNDLLSYMGEERALMVEELKPINPRMPLSDETIERLVGDDELKKYIQTQYGVNTTDTSPVKENATLSAVHLSEENSVVEYINSVGVDASWWDEVESFNVDTHGDDVRFSLNSIDDYRLADDEQERTEILEMINDNPSISMTEIATATKRSLESVIMIVGILIGEKLVNRSATALETTKKAKQAVAKLPSNRVKLEIMYKYEVDPDAPPLKTKSRLFCQTLMNSNKLFSREDIEGMRNHMNPTFINDINDVWRYRGGWYRQSGSDVSVPMCRHRWKQVVVSKK